MSELAEAMKLFKQEDEVEGGGRYLYLAHNGHGKTAAALEWAEEELKNNKHVFFLGSDSTTSYRSKKLDLIYKDRFVFCNVVVSYLPSVLIPWRDDCSLDEEQCSIVIDDFSMVYRLIEQNNALTNVRETIRSFAAKFLGRFFITNTLGPRSGPNVCCPVDYAGNFAINRGN